MFSSVPAPRTLRSTRATLAILTVGAVAMATLVVSARGARADAGASFVAMTNAQRSAHGLQTLAVSGDLVAVARAQATRMAASHTLAHTPNLPSAVCCWAALGENVGEGPSVSSIEAAFMASPEHRANILSAAYTQVGIATVTDSSGVTWVSEVFRRPKGVVTPPPAAPRPPAKPKPTPTQRPPATHHNPAVRQSTVTQSNTTAISTQTRASRDTARSALAQAQELAKQLDDVAVQGVDPVSRLLDFVAINASAD